MSEQKYSPIDKTILKPAEENPWYVLATICDEDPIMPVEGTMEMQVGLHRLMSRDIWNAWAFSKLRDEQKVILKDERPDLIQGLQDWEKISKDTYQRFKSCKKLFPSLEQGIVFTEIDFIEDTRFENFIFPCDVIFNKAKFSGIANFNNAIFFGNAIFRDTIFSKEIDFCEVIFSKRCIFRRSIFSTNTFFTRAEFNFVDFIDTVCDSTIFFVGTKFNHFSYFGDCEFHGSCRLREARFEKEYPIFEGIVLDEKTTITAKEEYWPDPKKCEQSPEEARASCEVLRHTLNNQGLPEQAHFFFRREMQFAGRIGSLWQRLPYKLFGWLSNYGYSIYRPAFGLIALWLGFASVYKVFSSLTFTESLGLSIASLFQFTGWQRVYFSELMQCLPVWLKILAGSQTIAGIVLLFLLGLGLRNRFRFK
ncbi:MAG: pentapeptide repeat-containing protein [Porticoccaceae bacterium]